MKFYAEGLPEGEQEEIERYILSKRGKNGQISDNWKKNSHNLVYRSLILLHKNLNKNLSECTDHDIEIIMGDIKENNEYKKNYRRVMVHAFRAFLLWYAKSHKNLSSSEIAGIQLPEKVWKSKKPKDMLSKQEFEELLTHCRNTRDRCLVAMLWDGSNRPVELLNLTWDDLIRDDMGYYFNTSVKTGKERRIRMTISVPYIDEWKRNYPGEPEGENPVFCTVNKVKGGLKPLTKDNLDRIVLYLKKTTGNKKLKPSIFRPSRITSDVKDGYDLQYVMKKNWGHLKTAMIDLYTNLDEEYIDQTALRKAGMERVTEMKEKEIYRLEPPVCPACGTLNVLGAEFCAKCIAPLTESAKMQLERADVLATKALGELLANPEAHLDEIRRFKKIMDSC